MESTKKAANRPFPVSAAEITVQKTKRGRDSRFYRVASKSAEFVTKTLAVASVIATPVVINNFELFQAYEATRSYEEPDKDDIIPERVGCSEMMPVFVGGGGGQSVRPLGEYNPAADRILEDVGGSTSAARRSTEIVSNTEFPVVYEPLISLEGGFFNRVVTRDKVEFGADLEIRTNKNSLPFSFDADAVDSMYHLVFDDLTIYENPEIRSILECKKREVIDAGYFKGLEIQSNIAPENNRFLLGNKTGAYIDAIPSIRHTKGLGSPKVSLDLGYMGQTADHIIIITGLGKDEESLNELILHELIHVWLYQDLSDTLSEIDEQERSVQYITEAVVQSLGESNEGKLPKVVQTGVGEWPADYELRNTPLNELQRAAIYTAQLALGAIAIGALWTFKSGKKPAK